MAFDGIREDLDRLSITAQVGGSPTHPDVGIDVVGGLFEGLLSGGEKGGLSLLEIGRQLRSPEILAEEGDGLYRPIALRNSHVVRRWCSGLRIAVTGDGSAQGTESQGNEKTLARRHR
jgi:hypothetical protein